jgi:hypothetical protein
MNLSVVQTSDIGYSPATRGGPVWKESSFHRTASCTLVRGDLGSHERDIGGGLHLPRVLHLHVLVCWLDPLRCAAGGSSLST